MQVCWLLAAYGWMYCMSRYMYMFKIYMWKMYCTVYIGWWPLIYQRYISLYTHFDTSHFPLMVDWPKKEKITVTHSLTVFSKVQGYHNTNDPVIHYIFTHCECGKHSACTLMVRMLLFSGSFIFYVPALMERKNKCECIYLLVSHYLAGKLPVCLTLSLSVP